MYAVTRLLRLRLRMLFLVSFTSIISEAASDINPARRQQHDVKHAFDRVTMGLNDHLAVVVPTHRGELPRVASSLQRWPSSCSPVTKRSVDLVLYYAEGDEDSEAAKEVVEVTTATAGLCFATTRVVYAYLDDEEDFYPKGPSVQFYKMFLDEGVSFQLEQYDALAIIEWDVLVADDRSFEELYKAAFSGTGDVWVKGSNVGGTSFHPTSEVQEMWHILGHINGNAIYNNNDPAFVEYVKYTRARWQYDYSYDVALWLTISDFPYSWPLWQRYNSKFVATNLISYVGAEHVDNSTVSDAVESHTLFIHGSKIESGNMASIRAANEQANKVSSGASAKPQEVHAADESACSSACGDRNERVLVPGTSTVCDKTCAVGGRFGGFLCGAGDREKFGSMCRLCFTDAGEARKAERESVGVGPMGDDAIIKHVIMCDTMQPPALEDCTHECAKSKNAVCDSSCGTGRYGNFNCNWRYYGNKCRFCFDDQESALMADEVAKRHGGRVIMCSTLEPPQVASSLPVANSRALKKQSRKLEDWETESCLDGCTYTSTDGTSGRVCDVSCQNGVPFGLFGCSTNDGEYGAHCRACYIDTVKAMSQMDKGDTVIMCDTLAPPSVYRRLQPVDKPENALTVARKLQLLRKGVKRNPVKQGKITEKSGDKWPRNLASTPDCLDGCAYTAEDGTEVPYAMSPAVPVNLTGRTAAPQGTASLVPTAECATLTWIRR
ncbi:unnamed protein product [Ascophyllum nodosum]